MFDSLTKLFEGKNIIWNMTLRNQLKNVKIQNAKTIQSYFTRVSQIKEQLEVVEEEKVENVEVVITTLDEIPGMCARRKCLLLEILWEEHTQEDAQLIVREKKMGRSSSHHPKKIPQAMRNIRTQLLKNLLSILAFG